MSEPTLFDDEPTVEVLPEAGQRLAFTGDGRHWHGTVTRTLTGHDGKSRVRIDVDPGSHGVCAAVLRLGSHLRPTVKGEDCPECGKPDDGPPLYSRP